MKGDVSVMASEENITKALANVHVKIQALQAHLDRLSKNVSIKHTTSNQINLVMEKLARLKKHQDALIRAKLIAQYETNVDNALTGVSGNMVTVARAQKLREDPYALERQKKEGDTDVVKLSLF
jgi:hypothetical protein